MQSLATQQAYFGLYFEHCRMPATFEQFFDFFFNQFGATNRALFERPHFLLLVRQFIHRPKTLASALLAYSWLISLNTNIIQFLCKMQALYGFFTCKHHAGDLF